MFPMPLSRDDRSVRHCRLRVRAGAPVQRLSFTIEEALRLSSLPGESEGRVYFFRRMNFVGLPESGDRQLWLSKFQSALLAEAASAVHGSNPAARHANGVYFRNQQEACTLLLTQSVQQRLAEGWFWPAVSGSAFGASTSTQVTGAITQLARSDAAWLAVASVVLALDNPPALLALIPEAQARQWLRELDDASDSALFATVIALRGHILQTIQYALTHFAIDDPRVLWLTTLAVIQASPAEAESGTAVSHARTILHAFTSAKRQHPSERSKALAPLEANPEFPSTPSVVEEHTAAPSNTSLEAASLQESPIPTFSPPAVEDHTGAPLNVSPIRDNHHPLSRAEEDPLEHLFGAPTAAAGLFFLLNVLPHLGIANRHLSPQFLAHLFQHIARRAGIKPEDPILLWSTITLAESDPEPIDRHLLRVWHRKLRRWCWRNGKIGIAAVVRRPGMVMLTRTHLDVSLALDSADIRIRRIGLDLDPGWLRWFGRVVRFHYHYRGGGQ